MKDGVPSKDYVDLELLNKQLQNLDNSLKLIDEDLGFASVATSVLSELTKTSKDQEILIPVGNGIFFSVLASAVKNVKVAVGSGVVVDKSFSDAENYIVKQINELENYRSDSINLYNQLANKALEVQKRIESNLNKKNNIN